MVFVRIEIPKWKAFLDLINHEIGRIHYINNSEVSTLREETEKNEEVDNDSTSSNNENEDGSKNRKKRKRIVTRARKVIPGLSFFVLFFIVEY